MTQPPFGPPPGGPERSDDRPLPSPSGPGIPDAAAPPPGGPAPGSSPSGYAGATSSPAPQWQQLPPEQLARMHQPGIVPLRPLNLGDIFGGALQTMRRNPEATIGLGLIVLAALLVPSFLLNLVAVRTFTQLQDVDLDLINSLVNTAFSLLATVALGGVIVHVVGEAVLGDRAGLSTTWKAVRGRIPALVGTVLIVALLFGVILTAMVFGVVLIVLAIDGGAFTGTSILVVILGVVLGGVLLLWLSARLTLATAPVVLERVGPLRGIARGWRLSAGGQAWRILGITLLAGLVTSIASSLITFPLTLVMLTGLESAGLEFGVTSTAYLLAIHLMQLVVGAVTTPFSAGVTALLYLDQRIRREGLDITLVQAAQARAAARVG